MTAMYAQTDKTLAALSKVTSAEFMRPGAMRLDELNIISVSRTVNSMYDRLLANNRKAYLDIALTAYEAALTIPESAIPPDDSWVDVQLGEYNPVTGYLYYSEADRKRMRLIEQILTAAEYKNRKMFDDAIRTSARLWWNQTAQYAIDITDAATLAAYADCGVKRVVWVSEDDVRVCTVCKERDGKIYPIEDVPEKTHYACRCYLVPVK